MINEYFVKRYCSEDISLIENYYNAINSPEKWDCHHKNEILLSKSVNELKSLNMYYNVQAKDLIFLTHKEHISLHKKNGCVTDKAKKQISETLMGHKSWNKGKTGVYSEEIKAKMREAALKRWKKCKQINNE